MQFIRKNQVSLTPTDKYLNLLQNQPELAQRVPQYYLSSYLDMTPEHLSRIRKKIKDKDRSPDNFS